MLAVVQLRALHMSSMLGGCHEQNLADMHATTITALIVCCTHLKTLRPQTRPAPPKHVLT